MDAERADRGKGWEEPCGTTIYLAYTHQLRHGMITARSAAALQSTEGGDDE